MNTTPLANCEICGDIGLGNRKKRERRLFFVSFVAFIGTTGALPSGYERVNPSVCHPPNHVNHNLIKVDFLHSKLSNPR